MFYLVLLHVLLNINMTLCHEVVVFENNARSVLVKPSVPPYMQDALAVANRKVIDFVGAR